MNNETMNNETMNNEQKNPFYPLHPLTKCLE